MLKVCSKCGVPKETKTEFYHNRRAEDGFRIWCKDCWAKNHPDKGVRARYYKKLKERKERKTRRVTEEEKNKKASCRKKYNNTTRGRYTKLKHHVASRKLDFLITFDEYATLVNESADCYYCGITAEKISVLLEFVHKYNGEDAAILKMKKPFGCKSMRSKFFSVDRKNSFTGYTKDNCVLCCSICNHVKAWAVPADLYKSIAPGTIANIVKICTDAGLVI